MSAFRLTAIIVHAVLATLILANCSHPPGTQCEDIAKSPWLRIQILSANYAASPFEESCALLENTLRQAIVSSEKEGTGLANAKLLTMRIDVRRSGAKAIDATNLTVLELLDKFCKTWDIRAIVSGYVVVIKD